MFTGTSGFQVFMAIDHLAFNIQLIIIFQVSIFKNRKKKLSSFSQTKFQLIHCAIIGFLDYFSINNIVIFHVF
jgi:hypothetical protein